jgi:hypothetical protein
MPDQRRVTPSGKYPARLIAEAHEAARAGIVAGLRERLDTPLELPSEIATLLTQLAKLDER